MSIKATMKELEKSGTAQNRKVYARHGVEGPMFGVSYANLKSLTRKIGRDSALAEQLWGTGNHDARVLATMVADPETVTGRTLDSWAKDIDSYVISDAFSGLVGKTKFAARKADKWARSKNDFLGQVGWNLIGGMAMREAADDTERLQTHLETIEREIHTRPNRTRHAMNMALCAIGIGCEHLRQEAIAVARRVGQVDVDHGQTGCKTPSAEEYINKAAKRHKKRR